MSLKVIKLFLITRICRFFIELDVSLRESSTFLVMESWLYLKSTGNKIKIIKHCHLLFKTIPFLSPFRSPGKVTPVSSNRLQVLNKEDSTAYANPEAYNHSTRAALLAAFSCRNQPSDLVYMSRHHIAEHRDSESISQI